MRQNDHHSDVIGEECLVPQTNIQSKALMRTISFLVFYNVHFYTASDVKCFYGTVQAKIVLLWNHEAYHRCPSITLYVQICCFLGNGKTFDFFD